MNVKVQFCGWLQNELKRPINGEWVEVAETLTVYQLLQKLGVARSYPMMLVVNGQRVSGDAKLENGNEVKIIPLVGGG